MTQLFDANTHLSESIFKAQNDKIRELAEVQEKIADDMQESLEKETLEAAAQILRNEVM